MAEYLIQDTTLTSIADAIRNKTGGTDVIDVNDMANQILSIAGGVKDIPTEIEMDEALVAANIGKIYRYTGETGEKYVSGDIYIVEGDT